MAELLGFSANQDPPFTQIRFFG